PVSAGVPSCRKNCKGKLYSVTLDGQCMTYEVPANVHYGYVGRVAGFTENRLLKGASDAQVSEGRGEKTDDPRDVQSIKKGFALFNAGSPDGLSKSGLGANHYDKLPAGDGDPAGCEACTTKLP
ncbi:MAG: polymorphic toxin type 44 domain-containing protein, partial [Thermoanaerobaculia bacterium]